MRKTINSNPLKTIKTPNKRHPTKAVTASSQDKPSINGVKEGLSIEKVRPSKNTKRVHLIKIGAKKMENSQLPQGKMAAAILEEDVAKTAKDTSKTTEVQGEATPDFRMALAKTTVKNYSLWATAAGFIPVTFLDAATIAGVQLKMIYDLCEIYKVPFKKEAALAVISAITGGGVTTFVAGKLVDLGIKKIPYVGSILSIATQPAISYGTTYGLGKIFIQHFEDSGTLMNIDVAEAKANFKKHYENAKSDYFKQMNKAKAWFKKEDKIVDAEVKEVSA